jgi:hypothetical protein
LTLTAELNLLRETASVWPEHKRVSEDLTKREIERYSRHLLLPEIGVEGQKKLLSTSVLVVGAGGLSSTCAMYLAGSGVGTVLGDRILTLQVNSGSLILTMSKRVTYIVRSFTLPSEKVKIKLSRPSAQLWGALTVGLPHH